MQLATHAHWKGKPTLSNVPPVNTEGIIIISINLLVVYRESVNLIGYITRRLSADSLQL